MTRRLAIASALLTSLAAANVQVVKIAPPLPRIAIVRVLDALTGIPLAGARVRFDSDVRSSTTDSTGTTKYHRTVSPKARVSAELGGYRRAFGSVWRATTDTFHATCELARIANRTIVCRVTDGKTGFPAAFASIRIDGAVGSSDLFGRCVLRGKLPDRSGFKARLASKPCAVVSLLPGPGDTVYADVALYDSTPTGTVTGTADIELERRAGVNVLLLGTDLGAVTDGNCSYTVRDVPPGDYLVQASYIACYTQTRWVHVTPGKPTTADWRLRWEPVK